MNSLLEILPERLHTDFLDADFRSQLKTYHDQIVSLLQQNNIIDLSTLPTKDERRDLKNQVKEIIETDLASMPIIFRSRIEEEFFGYGPVEPLLKDNLITEIIINGAEQIWYEKNGQLYQHSDCFCSPISFQNFIYRLSSEARVQANLDCPYADGYWRQYRLHLIIPPLAQGGAHLSLRRHPHNPWTLSRLEEESWAPPDALQFIRKLVTERASFLVVGATGTGKTSVLNACLQETAENERIITIEDSSELHLPNPLSAKLIARQDLQGILKTIDQAELLKQALRMRPDRIIMGEVRGTEAKDFLMTLSTGHTGGMGTLHADSARQALFRLEMLIQMGAPQWSPQAIRHLIYFGLQYIVCIKRTNGVRRLDSIHKIASLEESGFCLETVKENYIT